MVKRILVVDDEVHIRKIVSMTLEKAGYAVSTCQDGQEALDTIKKESVDLAIVDLAMPKVNGYEVITRFKQDEKTKNIPVIVLTAIGQDDELLLARQTGADEIMNKPFSPKKLVAKLDSMLK